MRKGFTNGEPWAVTAEQLKMKWGGHPRGLDCSLCGIRFKEGDIARWQYTNDVPGAGGNPIVCQNCDGPKEKIVARVREIYAAHRLMGGE